jgi:hypothetical protein
MYVCMYVCMYMYMIMYMYTFLYVCKCAWWPACAQCLCVYLYIDIDTHFKTDLPSTFFKKKTILQSSPAHSPPFPLRDKVPLFLLTFWQRIYFCLFFM